MAKFYAVLSFLFGQPLDVTGYAGNPYLYRWTILSTRWGRIYLHHFIGDDANRDLHDHPKTFTSIGLWGGYIEEFGYIGHKLGDATKTHLLKFQCEYRAPWFRRFPATHIHRLLVPGGNTWTLAIVGKPTREWGFYVDKPDGSFSWTPWRQYVDIYRRNINS